MTEALGWRWSLFINVPIALVALALGLPTIIRSPNALRLTFVVATVFYAISAIVAITVIPRRQKLAL